MKIILSFLFCGLVCLISEVILDNTKLTPGHITSMLVVIGSLLDIFNIYDKLVEIIGGGACVPITSFGHQLVHASLARANTNGLFGIFMGTFDLTASGITAAIVFSFFFTLLFKPRD